jgi:hypothetical protein
MFRAPSTRRVPPPARLRNAIVESRRHPTGHGYAGGSSSPTSEQLTKPLMYLGACEPRSSRLKRESRSMAGMRRHPVRSAGTIAAEAPFE